MSSISLNEYGSQLSNCKTIFDIREPSQGKRCAIISAIAMTLFISVGLVGIGIDCAINKPLNESNHNISSCHEKDEIFLPFAGGIFFLLASFLVTLTYYNSTKYVMDTPQEHKALKA